MVVGSKRKCPKGNHLDSNIGKKKKPEAIYTIFCDLLWKFTVILWSKYSETTEIAGEKTCISHQSQGKLKKYVAIFHISSPCLGNYK